jgi:adenylate cyclase
LLQHLDRKLAVILHADVVGSTRLVQKNESLAHQRIVDTFKQFESNIDQYNGVVHEIRGDALLAIFSRASDAVNAALTFQNHHRGANATIEDDILAELRVGIAMGEVIIADGTVTGAGVVLAQRLEQLCDAGEVMIQGAVYETLPKHLPLDFSSLGEQKLKGFDETVRAYRVAMEDDSGNSLSRKSESYVARKSVTSEKPSIAVLPFSNHSGDPEQ